MTPKKIRIGKKGPWPASIGVKAAGPPLANPHPCERALTESFAADVRDAFEWDDEMWDPQPEQGDFWPQRDELEEEW